MKTEAFILIVVATSAVAGEVIPSAFAKDRYNEMFAASPFHLETLPPTPDPAIDRFAGVYVSSMSLGENGRTVVYVKRPEDERGIRLVGNDVEKVSGFSIERVDWANGWKSATVTARHQSGAVKTLVFDAKNTSVQPAPIKNGVKPPSVPGKPPTSSGGKDYRVTKPATQIVPTTPNPNDLPRIRRR